MTRTPIAFKVNGEDVEVLVKPWQTLLEVLRDELRLTGTKEGCSNGNCGACTVQFDGKAIDSCLALGLEADGHDITTIEGVATGGSLHPIQQAFIDHGALQCGFCTPGMIITSVEILNRNPEASDAEVRHGLEGNICRCTGYENIVKAVVAAGARGSS
jgi:carbon-monoxide dehydrogenase small subunit